MLDFLTLTTERPKVRALYADEEYAVMDVEDANGAPFEVAMIVAERCEELSNDPDDHTETSFYELKAILWATNEDGFSCSVSAMPALFEPFEGKSVEQSIAHLVEDPEEYDAVRDATIHNQDMAARAEIISKEAA